MFMDKLTNAIDRLNVFDAIIIGAGMSGLTLANRLSKLTTNFLILEKSSGVGGRVATRRDGHDLYDHGAQFYKISPCHENPFDPIWHESGLSTDWFQENGIHYKISRTGMTAFAKSLAENKPVLFKKEVSSISLESGILSVTCLDGTVMRSKKIYITAPVPQAVSLLERSNFFLPEQVRNIQYAPALVGLFNLEPSTSSNLPSFKENISNEIFSISQQNTKFEKDNLTFTVIMNSEWSRMHFEFSDDENLSLMQDALRAYFRNEYRCNELNILKSQIKKWRYSHPVNPLTEGYFKLDEQIVLLGDGFLGPNINAAVKSGYLAPIDIES
jgi:renalase